MLCLVKVLCVVLSMDVCLNIVVLDVEIFKVLLLYCF